MKRMNFKKLIAVAAGVVTLGVSSVFAQEAEAGSGFDTDAGMDIYSSYVWRGAKFGTGAALQPWVEMSTGGLAFGTWGSVNTGFDEALEMDLYASYSLDMGLSLTVTDYYFGGDWTDFDLDSGMHYIEPSLSFETEGGLSVLGAFMIGPDTEDAYIELGYGFKTFDVAIGAGNGAYTDDGEFFPCNITIGKSKEIEITDKFTLPLSGAFTLNPSTGGFYAYVGISL